MDKEEVSVYCLTGPNVDWPVGPPLLRNRSFLSITHYDRSTAPLVFHGAKDRVSVVRIERDASGSNH